MQPPASMLGLLISTLLVTSACGDDGSGASLDAGTDANGGGGMCDPIAQTGCAAGQGCYVLISASTSVATCAGAGKVPIGQKITGQPFANSCVPGGAPRRPSAGSTEWECGGLCVPADVTAGKNEDLEGGKPVLNCQTKWGAPAPGAANGESCRYWWSREPFDKPSPFSNTLGFCFSHARFQYDSDGNQSLDAPWPRCTALTTGDVLPPVKNPPENDALAFWCVAEPG